MTRPNQKTAKYPSGASIKQINNHDGDNMKGIHLAFLASMWHEIFAGVYFADWRFFVFLRELIFEIKTVSCFSCPELIFAIFRKYPTVMLQHFTPVWCLVSA